MRNWTPVFLIGCGCVLASCGSSSSPKTPSTDSVVWIEVNSTNGQVLMGASETCSATAVRSDGSSQTVTGVAWSSDAPAVATVNAATGSVSGVKSGNATISADYQGLRGSKLIAVRPNYAG